jgi:anti-anti-sigma factor
MTTPGFEAEVRERERSSVIDLRGQIDGFAEKPLERAYVDAAGRAPSTILLNFQDVDYINSTGIALIVGLLARARKEGRIVRAYGMSDHYREIFQITRLVDFMSIFSDEESAASDTATATT